MNQADAYQWASKQAAKQPQIDHRTFAPDSYSWDREDTHWSLFRDREKPALLRIRTPSHVVFFIADNPSDLDPHDLGRLIRNGIEIYNRYGNPKLIYLNP